MFIYALFEPFRRYQQKEVETCTVIRVEKLSFDMDAIAYRTRYTLAASDGATGTFTTPFDPDILRVGRKVEAAVRRHKRIQKKMKVCTMPSELVYR
jgi:uncharacterized OB-fold protein